jgi:hypothetical protein
MNSKLTDRIKLINVLHKFDEIAADLRDCGYVEGDSTYDDLLKLRMQAMKDFELNTPISYL